MENFSWSRHKPKSPRNTKPTFVIDFSQNSNTFTQGLQTWFPSPRQKINSNFSKMCSIETFSTFFGHQKVEFQKLKLIMTKLISLVIKTVQSPKMLKWFLTSQPQSNASETGHFPQMEKVDFEPFTESCFNDSFSLYHYFGSISVLNAKFFLKLVFVPSIDVSIFICME